jgi:two-component system chemotaxis response regulator CheY
MAKIMIVDDSKMMVKVLTEYVNQYNPGLEIEVIVAYDGQESVELYKEQKPDLVFLDINMPNRDGLSALKEITTFDPAAKVIMVTSDTQDQSIKEAVVDGATDYITKPFKGEIIKRVLSDNLSQ